MKDLIVYKNKHGCNVQDDLPKGRSDNASKFYKVLSGNSLISCFLFCLRSYFNYLCSINNNLVGKICLN